MTIEIKTKRNQNMIYDEILNPFVSEDVPEEEPKTPKEGAEEEEEKEEKEEKEGEGESQTE